jgi:hypothetical protein
MAPHDAVLQTVIELGTAIDGKGFSLSALNGVQEFRRAQEILSIPLKNCPLNNCKSERVLSNWILTNRAISESVAAITVQSFPASERTG